MAQAVSAAQSLFKDSLGNHRRPPDPSPQLGEKSPQPRRQHIDRRQRVRSCVNEPGGLIKARAAVHRPARTLNMTKNAKIYLTISVVCILLGGIALLTDKTATMPQLYVPFPVGAVFFGLFLISAFLGKEAEQYSKEQHARQEAADRLTQKR